MSHSNARFIRAILPLVSPKRLPQSYVPLTRSKAGVELWLVGAHPTGMNAIAGTCTEHEALLEEYRVALHDWRVARANDPLNSQCPAVLEATKRLEELEHKITVHQTEHGCLHHVPQQADL